MAKIEEISELLVSEISDFEQLVLRLEAVQQEQIRIDITELKEQFSAHKDRMEQSKEAIETCVKELGIQIEQSRFYPNWAIIVFCISMLFNCIAVAVWFF